MTDDVLRVQLRTYTWEMAVRVTPRSIKKLGYVDISCYIYITSEPMIKYSLTIGTALPSQFMVHLG